MRLSLPTAILAALIPLTGVSTGFSSAARLHQAASVVAVTTGAEGLDNATDYFDHARKLGFPAAGQTTPYVLRAEFTTRTTSGAVMKGTYTDTWVNQQKWRREAIIGESRFVRTRNGRKWYRVDDGPDAALLQFVLTAMEPIPATDTGHAGNWKVQRVMADGETTIQIWRGKENSDGTPDPKEFEGYWFNAGGDLIRSYLNGLDIKREKFEDFNGVHVARQLQVTLTGKVGMRIDVTALQPAGAVDPKMFTLKGNGWRHYTSEVR